MYSPELRKPLKKLLHCKSLTSLNLILYTFASDTTFAKLLTQKTEDKQDMPITFMSVGLQGEELKYPHT